MASHFLRRFRCEYFVWRFLLQRTMCECILWCAYACVWMCGPTPRPACPDWCWRYGWSTSHAVISAGNVFCHFFENRKKHHDFQSIFYHSNMLATAHNSTNQQQHQRRRRRRQRREQRIKSTQQTTCDDEQIHSLLATNWRRTKQENDHQTEM